MDRKSIFFVPAPGEEDGQALNWLKVRLADNWFAVDGDRLVLPVVKLRRNGEDDNERVGLLSQYGGSDLALDVVSLGLEEGDEFVIVNPSDGRPYVDENHEAAP